MLIYQNVGSAPEEPEVTGQAPTVITKPKAQQVTEGDNVTFETKLTASPTPQVHTLIYYMQLNLSELTDHGTDFKWFI